MFHLVCISLGTTGFALGFLFLVFGLWCWFGFLLGFLVRCLGNFDLIFILIPLLTDNVTHSSGNAGKKKHPDCPGSEEAMLYYCLVDVARLEEDQTEEKIEISTNIDVELGSEAGVGYHYSFCNFFRTIP